MARKTEPKPYHHGDLHHALVEAGVRVLAEQGVAGMNLREVARQAGVSHAAPYRHFADKQALLAAIAEDGFRKLADEIHSFAPKPGMTAADKLTKAGRTYVRFALDHPAHFKLMFSSASERLEDTNLYHLSKVGFEFLVETIREGQKAKLFVKGDPVDYAKALWAAMHGLATLLIENQFVKDPNHPITHKQAEDMAVQCIAVTINGLLA